MVGGGSQRMPHHHAALEAVPKSRQPNDEPQQGRRDNRELHGRLPRSVLQGA